MLSCLAPATSPTMQFISRGGTFEPEFIASVREKGVTPKFFRDENEANLVAKRLGGVVVVASWKGDKDA